MQATCTSSGRTEGEICEKCGKTLKEAATIPALGHKFENYVCKVCGVIDNKHAYDFFVNWIIQHGEKVNDDYYVGDDESTGSTSDGGTYSIFIHYYTKDKTLHVSTSAKHAEYTFYTMTTIPSKSSGEFKWSGHINQNQTMLMIGSGTFNPKKNVSEEKVVVNDFDYNQFYIALNDTVYNDFIDTNSQSVDACISYLDYFLSKYIGGIGISDFGLKKR